MLIPPSLLLRNLQETPDSHQISLAFDPMGFTELNAANFTRHALMMSTVRGIATLLATCINSFGKIP